jgi:hypothetical protein
LKGIKAAAALALMGVCLARGAAADTRSVDYLYVEANEGDSSGGHVALRIGADTFHFQQEIGSLIRMRRDAADVFHFRYAMLGNRAIHASRIAVSDETYALLRDGFTRRLLVQTAQYRHGAVLQDDVELFELWRERLNADPTSGVPVRAAGYFLPDGFPGAAPVPGRSPVLVALAASVAQAHGDTFVAERIASLRTALAAWQPAAARGPAPALALDAYPAYAPTASTDYRERIEALTALEVLAAARRCAPGAAGWTPRRWPRMSARRWRASRAISPPIWSASRPRGAPTSAIRCCSAWRGWRPSRRRCAAVDWWCSMPLRAMPPSPRCPTARSAPPTSGPSPPRCGPRPSRPVASSSRARASTRPTTRSWRRRPTAGSRWRKPARAAPPCAASAARCCRRGRRGAPSWWRRRSPRPRRAPSWWPRAPRWPTTARVSPSSTATI